MPTSNEAVPNNGHKVNSQGFVTGYGQNDTHALTLSDGTPNPHKSAGRPYATITGKEIAAMVKDPPRVEKKAAQWFIPSQYVEQDARSHDAQRQNGSFRCLTLDVDTNDLSIEVMQRVIGDVVDNASYVIHSSRSAKETDRKWRAIIFLKHPIAGDQFSDVQNAFFDLLENASNGVLIPDRALSRPAQLVYLPNKGEFYQYALHKGGGCLDLTPVHRIMQHKAKVDDARERAAREAKEAREHRDAARRAAAGRENAVSPIEAFNAIHTVTDLLDRYGYKQAESSSDWRSPFQSSGSYATRNYGCYWVSLSDSDDAQDIGAKTVNGHRYGDAFDLFVHFEHDGDIKKAVAAYGAEIRPGRSRHTTAKAQSKIKTPLDDAPQTPKARSFDELLEAAKALELEQIAEMEAIVFECTALNPMRRDGVFRAIKEATGVPLGTMRDQLLQERDVEPVPDHLDLARRTLDGVGRQNLICANAFVWRWSLNGVWRQQDDRAIKQEVQNCIDGDAMINVTAGLVSGVTDVLQNEIFQPDHEFNLGHPETVNCLNGELELNDFLGWYLEPHCREHFRTTQIPVAYDLRADAPQFRAFLEQVFQDDPDKADKTKALLELMGYTLMSHARHEKFVMLIGPGANGKSVLLGVLEKLCGVENVAGVQPANFDRSFQRAHLHQKLANIVTELKQREVIADAELKAITSGEPSTVEHKFRDPFVMRPFATCWFGTNHMPHTRDFSEALFRRAVILQFNRTFAKHEQDPLLTDKLLAELPGILNLSLKAYDDALHDGFTAPASSEAAKQEWRLEADQVAQFVDDVCTRDAEARSKAADVFAAYRDWALDNGIKQTVSQKGLRDRLTRLGFGYHKDRHARYVTGLRAHGRGVVFL